jgi:hypothetical protein
MTGIREEPRRVRPDVPRADNSDVHVACSIFIGLFSCV